MRRQASAKQFRAVKFIGIAMKSDEAEITGSLDCHCLTNEQTKTATAFDQKLLRKASKPLRNQAFESRATVKTIRHAAKRN